MMRNREVDGLVCGEVKNTFLHFACKSTCASSSRARTLSPLRSSPKQEAAVANFKLPKQGAKLPSKWKMKSAPSCLDSMNKAVAHAMDRDPMMHRNAKSAQGLAGMGDCASDASLEDIYMDAVADDDFCVCAEESTDVSSTIAVSTPDLAPRVAELRGSLPALELDSPVPLQLAAHLPAAALPRQPLFMPVSAFPPSALAPQPAQRSAAVGMLVGHIAELMRQKGFTSRDGYLLMDVYLEVWKDVVGEVPGTSRSNLLRFAQLLAQAPDHFELLQLGAMHSDDTATSGEQMVRLRVG